MAEFGKVSCPECGRFYSAMVKDSGKTNEVPCGDCEATPGWNKDFDSPPTRQQWTEFKRSGEKIRGNQPRG